MSSLNLVDSDSSQQKQEQRLPKTLPYSRVQTVVGEPVKDHCAPPQCLITKRPSYALKKTYWIEVVKDNPERKKLIETFLKDLCVVNQFFDLDNASNVTNLDPILHASLNKFGFFAVTASEDYLTRLIDLVRQENTRWQAAHNKFRKFYRSFWIEQPPLSEYQMVDLHPLHLLPNGSELSVFSRIPETDLVSGKQYVVGCDRTLREYPGTLDCRRIPTFSSESMPRLNVFLVVLNAGIKFQRYRRISSMPPLQPDIERLIDLTLELVDLIYWEPSSQTEEYLQRKRERSRPEANLHADATAPGWGVGPDSTLKERREYAYSLLSDRGCELTSAEVALLEEIGYHRDDILPRYPVHNSVETKWHNGVQEGATIGQPYLVTSFFSLIGKVSRLAVWPLSILSHILQLAMPHFRKRITPDYLQREKERSRAPPPEENLHADTAPSLGVVKPPGPNSTLEERREYAHSLLSDREFELTSEAVALLEEIGYRREDILPKYPGNSTKN